MRIVLTLFLTLLGCSKAEHKTSLVYFGFDNRLEKSEDAITLAKTWSSNPLCPGWRATIDPKTADYQVLFGDVDVTVVDRRGVVLYSGGPGALYLPHGNPDGSGVNICKLTGSD